MWRDGKMSIRARQFLRVALLTALAMLLAWSSAFADSISVKLNATTKIYQSASTSARSIKAPRNLKVTLKGYSDGWGKISYKGHTGYVKLRYLDRVDPVKAYVTESATIYKDAEGSKKLGAVSAGATVYVVGVDGGYVRVTDKSGNKVGYIKASVLSGSKAALDDSESGDVGGGDAAADAVPESLRSTTTNPSDSKIEFTIYLAQNLIGAPYAGDANPPKSFDCAKFCYYCYGQAQSGSIGSSSYGQGYDERYRKIAFDDLKRGDMVCFDTVSDSDQCDHTGIYLGGGYFIHASSAANKVILSSLKSGYYKRTFSWGRRIFEN